MQTEGIQKGGFPADKLKNERTDGEERVQNRATAMAVTRLVYKTRHLHEARGDGRECGRANRKWRTQSEVQHRAVRVN